MEAAALFSVFATFSLVACSSVTSFDEVFLIDFLFFLFLLLNVRPPNAYQYDVFYNILFRMTT